MFRSCQTRNVIMYDALLEGKGNDYNMFRETCTTAYCSYIGYVHIYVILSIDTYLFEHVKINCTYNRILLFIYRTRRM